ncbi:MAG: group II intron reverse transcriptase/maturase [Oligoflexia bacterium]|nr:group II intron reverse transcriptase/maturase [Oligoflexia bacterium]
MGAETAMEKLNVESLANEQHLLEEILSRDNLKKALQRVKSNGGAAGADGMTVQELPEYLQTHWSTLKEQLQSGSYKPQPVRRVEIPKPDGGVRKLGVPTVVDRFIQQAFLQVLQKHLDPTFSEYSYGFRPGRSAQQAVMKAQEYIQKGYGWVVDLDLEKFFDRVNHDRLMARDATRVRDKRVLKYIHRCLTAGVLENGLVSPIDEGTPQGGPLSPLLSNIVLDELDQELTRRGHCFVRYADDANIYVRSQKAGARVMASVTRFITRRLKLKVNESKSAVDRPQNRKFLGFSFTKSNRRQLAAKTVERFKDKVRIITSRTGGKSLGQVVAQLKRYLSGWIQYFGIAQSKQDFRHLDSWIKRRLRCMLWKQWGTRSKRYRELKRLGIRSYTAWVTIKSGHGPWRLSRSPAVQQVLNAAFFKALGLPSLVDAHLLSSRRTAHYGTV